MGKRGRILIIIALLLTANKLLLGQEAILYSQLFNQPELFNPAVNGTAKGVRVGLFFRDQWMRIDGAPKTMAFDAFFPLNKERLGLGLTAFNHQIGLREINFLLVNANSYVNIDQSSTLSFGIRVGMELCTYNQNQIISIDNSKLNYQDLNTASPAFNIGLVYKSKNLYIGISSFQISYKDEIAENKILTGIDLLGGYFLRKNNIIIYPYSILKTYFSNFNIFESGVNAYFSDKFGVGIGYRIGESFDLNFKIKISRKLVMGYSYDSPLSEFSRMSNGSNEFYLGYVIGKKNILMPF